MATAPKRPCARPGCAALVESGYCEKHRQYAPQERRGNSAQRGYDRQYRKRRLEFLENQPWCLACLAEGKYVRADTVDHVKPMARGGSNESSNFQPLCKACNEKKGVKTTDYRLGA